ncbi:MAG: aldehyde dehydrogenase family protein [Candidatus Melainabacteria bacterium]|jgi:acyl-CoA reductase-like NAD-dependent aldehyde dehydrogenase|nr:aldehyde dehydrogenase family protein [Candidatus Melainabacteria bacterium]MBX9672261.1 aldehyde dehydrogenase family protein [Candidatus Obscuribacterales bacterium]
MTNDLKTLIQSINPADGAVLGQVPILDAAQVARSVEKARQTQASWQLTSLKERARLMSNLKRLVAESQDQLAALISQEVGKPLPEAYLSELNGPLDTMGWLADNAERLLQDQAIPTTNMLLASKQSVVAFEPLGVIGLISPWNYPFSIPMMTACMALMVGNTVVLKPSEKSPLIGIKIGELFLQAGFPQGCVEVITGDRNTGRYLTEQNLAKVIFTGSVSGGKNVMETCSRSLTPVTLELGGKDAAIVLPDAPVEWTSRGLVWGAFTNAGQACASVERVYVIKGKKNEHDRLIQAIIQETQKLKLGNPKDPATEVGPLIDQNQLDTVRSHVEDSIAKGARIACGGNCRQQDLGGYFFEPTVLLDVNHQMKVMTEETFGPVLPVMVVDNEDTAVELANESQYGLCATVWAKNLPAAEMVARDLDVGTVLINDVLYSHAVPQLPWGGIKNSGFGRSHAIFGLQDLCNIKHISIDSAAGSHRIWWYPYGPERIKMAQAGIKLLHGKMSERLGSLIAFIANSHDRKK